MVEQFGCQHGTTEMIALKDEFFGNDLARAMLDANFGLHLHLDLLLAKKLGSGHLPKSECCRI